jgi:hypothetical protein
VVKQTCCETRKRTAMTLALGNADRGDGILRLARFQAALDIAVFGVSAPVRRDDPSKKILLSLTAIRGLKIDIPDG